LDHHNFGDQPQCVGAGVGAGVGVDHLRGVEAAKPASRLDLQREAAPEPAVLREPRTYSFTATGRPLRDRLRKARPMPMPPPPSRRPDDGSP
jgi:hypothetical protein